MIIIKLALAYSVVAVALVSQVIAGPFSWGLFQTACNAGYVTWCAAAGGIAGTVALGLGVPAALAGCSVIQGASVAACTPILVAPAP